MDKIIENLKDPSWWFTAVIVAVVASLLAEYIKSVISRILSLASQKYRQQREERLKKEQRFAQKLADDPHLLTTTFLLGISSMLFFFFLVTTILLLPLWGNYVLPSVFLGRENIRQILAIVVLGIPAVNMGYRSSSSFGDVARALSIYIDKKKEETTSKPIRPQKNKKELRH